MRNNLIIFSGGSHPELSKEICDYLSLPLGLAQVRRFADESPLDVPGSPHAAFAAVRTQGHCPLYLPEHDAVITNDALVTRDPYADTGASLVTGGATADNERTLVSPERLAGMAPRRSCLATETPEGGSERAVREALRVGVL